MRMIDFVIAFGLVLDTFSSTSPGRYLFPEPSLRDPSHRMRWAL